MQHVTRPLSPLYAVSIIIAASVVMIVFVHSEPTTGILAGIPTGSVFVASLAAALTWMRADRLTHVSAMAALVFVTHCALAASITAGAAMLQAETANDTLALSSRARFESVSDAYAAARFHAAITMALASPALIGVVIGVWRARSASPAIVRWHFCVLMTGAGLVPALMFALVLARSVPERFRVPAPTPDQWKAVQAAAHAAPADCEVLSSTLNALPDDPLPAELERAAPGALDACVTCAERWATLNESSETCEGRALRRWMGHRRMLRLAHHDGRDVGWERCRRVF